MLPRSVEPSMKAATLLAETLMAALLTVPMFAQVTATDEKVPCRNYKDVLALFDRLGYTQKAWQAGIREIPRVYLEDELVDAKHDRGEEPEKSLFLSALEGFFALRSRHVSRTSAR